MDVHGKVFPFLHKIRTIIENENLEDGKRKEELNLVRGKLQELLEARKLETHITANADDDRPRPYVLDSAAVIQFPASQKSRATNLRPAKISQDGNSLYNACSRAVVGDESMSICLRCLTSVELYLNADHYAYHTLFEKVGEKSGHKDVLKYGLSVQCLESYNSDNPVAAIHAEALYNGENYKPGSFVCLLGLSSVLRQPIESYFPIADADDFSNDELLLNSLILPRLDLDLDSEVIHIFRCAGIPINYLMSGNFSEDRNHYVPLLPSKMVSDEVMNPPTLKKTSAKASKVTGHAVSRLLASSSTIANVGKQKAVLIPPSGFLSIGKPLLPKNPCSKELELSQKRKQTSIFDTMVKRKPKEIDLTNVDVVLSTIANPKSTATVTSAISSSDHSFEVLSSSVAMERGTSENAPANATLSVRDIDIGTYYQSVQSLSDSQKYNLLQNTWKPPMSYSFPSNSSRRRFQFKWFSAFSWLSYSAVLDGAFCINCVLFGGESSHNASKLTYLYKLPFNQWSTAVKRFNDHATKSPVHETATLRATQFRACMENKATSINVQYDGMISKIVETNRKKLVPIAEAVILCGRQNIPLRGHRDDSQHYNEPKNNPGNFQAILQFLVKCGNNTIFEGHMSNAAKSATYRSKTTQNAIVGICGEMIKKSIIDEIKMAKFFSVLADEAADVSNQEQMALVLRFVDQNSLIRESFLGFCLCVEGLSGQAIAANILQVIRNLDLDINLCRGQGYDGAGNMAGKCNGASTIIQREYPKALYVHCKSHVLNLCVATSCKLQIVRNMMGQVRVVSEFFNVHPKRFAVLKEEIESLPDKDHKHLLDVCRTRWVARIDGLGVFIEVFEAVISCLESIKNNENRSWNPESVKDANGLFFATVSFEFIVCLVIVSRLLDATRPLTKLLQSPVLDVVSSVQNISLLFAVLQRLRREVDDVHKKWYEEAVKLASTVGTSPSQPRIARVQQHRANTPADSPLEYYRRVVTLPFLEHLTNEIEKRFSQENVNVLHAFYALPPKVVSDPSWYIHFDRFLSVYKNDLPEPRYISNELRTWETKWKITQGTLPSSLAAVLPLIDRITFPNMYTALQIAATIPVTSCSCERSISVLRRLKTYLRNTMGQARMNGLAMMNVHREIPLDTNKVIDQFARENPRRMKLRDILSEPVDGPGDR